VKGSPNKLGQVMTNLLVNAMQALPDRSRSENRIAVSLAPDEAEGWVRLAVEDNGAGIPEAVREHIFDPFFTTKTQGGTGLGLAISKRIVEEVGGPSGSAPPRQDHVYRPPPAAGRNAPTLQLLAPGSCFAVPAEIPAALDVVETASRWRIHDRAAH
jgi:polar amino acid transport system substrate-binding protein